MCFLSTTFPNALAHPPILFDYSLRLTIAKNRVYLFVEGSLSRARVPCRGSRVTFFFSKIFFLEKVIIDAINVIKTNKKNLKNKWRGNDLLVVGLGGGGDGIDKSSGTSIKNM